MWLLIDFDISTEIGQEFGPKSPAIAYAAPEVAQDIARQTISSRKADTSMDFWSLGAVLYQMVCDRPLWCSSRSGEIMSDEDKDRFL